MMNPLRHILLVEDDEKDAELTQIALEENCLEDEVIVVKGGEEALDYLYYRGKFSTRHEGNPILVLLDLKMPKLDGLEVLQQMKSDEELKKIPTVMLTSSREERDVTRSYELAVNAYVVKPIDFKEFKNALKGIGLFWAVINENPPENGQKGKKRSEDKTIMS